MVTSPSAARCARLALPRTDSHDVTKEILGAAGGRRGARHGWGKPPAQPDVSSLEYLRSGPRGWGASCSPGTALRLPPTFPTNTHPPVKFVKINRPGQHQQSSGNQVLTSPGPPPENQLPAMIPAHSVRMSSRP